MKQCEVFGVLKKIGLGIVKKEDLRQVCIKDCLIRTEMIDFKIDCNNADEVLSVASVVEQTSFIGNHEVIIGEYKYPVKLICFGFCNVCKKSGHKSFECEVRKSMREKILSNVRCNLCEELGHYSKGCSKKNEILQQRLAKTRCHKCRELGHLSNKCINEGPAWIDNTPIIEESTEQSILNVNNNNNNNDDIIYANNIFATSTSTPSTINNNNNNIQEINVDPTIATIIASIAVNNALMNEPSGTKRPSNLLSENLSENLQKKAACDTSNQSENTSAGAEEISMNDSVQS